MADLPEYTPMTAQHRANVQDVIDQLTEVGEATGGWTDKVDARQTGCSYHAKFANKVDVWTAVKWANLLGQAPAMLADACRKYLAADAAIAKVEDALTAPTIKGSGTDEHHG